MENSLEFEREKIRIKKDLDKTLKKLTFRKGQLEEGLRACERWEEVHHEGDLLKTNLGLIKKGMTSVTVWDWKSEQNREIEINPKRTPKDEMAHKFHRAKKLQNGFVPLQKQLNHFLELIHKTEKKLEGLELAVCEEDLEPFRQVRPQIVKPKVRVEAALPYHEFESEAGFKVLVGRSAKANDKLTFQVANGNDWWLHVSGYPGSHIVIRTGKDREPDQDTLYDAMQLALYYSKAKDRGEGEICITQKKYVTKMSGYKPGKVQISKHKVKWIKLDKPRLNVLRGRDSS